MYNHSKYSLSICELYWPNRHGTWKLNEFSTYHDYLFVQSGYICMTDLHPYEFHYYYSTFVKPALINYKNYYSMLLLHYNRRNENVNHDYIQNYQNILSDNRYLNVDIVQKVNINGLTTAIIKTTYLRQFQRKWKAIYKERKRIIRLRCNLHNIHYREIHGKWPNSCFHLPTLQCH
jgi:hypothetical protein